MYTIYISVTIYVFHLQIPLMAVQFWKEYCNDHLSCGDIFEAPSLGTNDGPLSLRGPEYQQKRKPHLMVQEEAV